MTALLSSPTALCTGKRCLKAKLTLKGNVYNRSWHHYGLLSWSWPAGSHWKAAPLLFTENHGVSARYHRTICFSGPLKHNINISVDTVNRFGHLVVRSGDQGNSWHWFWFRLGRRPSFLVLLATIVMSRGEPNSDRRSLDRTENLQGFFWRKGSGKPQSLL